MGSTWRYYFWKFLEWGYFPDWLVRRKIRSGLAQLLTELGDGNVENETQKLRDFIAEIKTMPIAVNQSDANEQHYEVPSSYYKMVLGPYLKYSSGLWPEPNTTLKESEETMLELYTKRAQLKDGMTILDLGCGWGSVTLFVAKKFPKIRVFSLSNSSTQREFIESRAKEEGLKNVTVFTGDVAVFQSDEFKNKFDRIISIEMFEHMKNYEKLMAKVSDWLSPTGKIFIHIFTHKKFAYHFQKGWMARTFFTGGTMPSQDLLLNFQDRLVLEDQWAVNGVHYSKTLEAWLKLFDEKYVSEIKPIFEATYGTEQAGRWYAGWRMFFIVCSETFAYNNGNEWFVSHYLFAKK